MPVKPKNVTNDEFEELLLETNFILELLLKLDKELIDLHGLSHARSIDV